MWWALIIWGPLAYCVIKGLWEWVRGYGEKVPIDRTADEQLIKEIDRCTERT